MGKKNQKKNENTFISLIPLCDGLQQAYLKLSSVFPKRRDPVVPTSKRWTLDQNKRYTRGSWYFMIFHDISWSSCRVQAISWPFPLKKGVNWGAHHSIQHVLPHHFAKHGICPKTKDQVVVQRRGVLLHQLFLQHHLSIVAAHLLASFQQVAALILAATMPCGRLH